MEYPSINTRADFDSATPAEQARFKTLLQGSIYRIEKDDVAACWKAVEDNSAIERFGFVRADFPNAVPQELPVYVAPEPKTPEWKLERIAAYAKLNQFEMQFDDATNGTTTWKDAITAIKAQYPKG